MSVIGDKAQTKANKSPNKGQQRRTQGLVEVDSTIKAAEKGRTQRNKQWKRGFLSLEREAQLPFSEKKESVFEWQLYRDCNNIIYSVFKCIN